VNGLNDNTLDEVCYKCSVSHNLEKHLLTLQSRHLDQTFDSYRMNASPQSSLENDCDGYNISNTIISGGQPCFGPDSRGETPPMNGHAGWLRLDGIDQFAETSRYRPGGCDPDARFSINGHSGWPRSSNGLGINAAPAPERPDYPQGNTVLEPIDQNSVHNYRRGGNGLASNTGFLDRRDGNREMLPSNVHNTLLFSNRQTEQEQHGLNQTRNHWQNHKEQSLSNQQVNYWFPNNEQSLQNQSDPHIVVGHVSVDSFSSPMNTFPPLTEKFYSNF